MASLPALVLDNGTGTLKCGFAGSNFPSCVFPTAVGRPLLRSASRMKQRRSSPLADETGAVRDIVCGTEVTAQRHLLELSYPISNGIIQNMEDMQLLWDHSFHTQMGLTAEDLQSRRLLLSEVPLLSTRHRCQMYEIFFETYGFEAVQSALQGVLSLFANGLETGVAVECGEGISHCTPIYEGYALPNANRCVHLGGRDITRFLARLLQCRGHHNIHEKGDLEAVRIVKERVCYAAVDIALEWQLATQTTALEKKFTLPDGSTCVLGQERFEATEALFQPHLIDIECDGLSTQLWSSIQAADIDVRTGLYSHIILSGGSTMFPGLSTRLGRDVQEMFVTHNLKGDRSRLRRFPLKVEDAPRRKLMVYLGGATLAALTADTPEMWLTRAAWEEGGVSAVIARYGP